MSRWACAQRQVELAREQPSLAGINIFPSHPGSKWMDSECIWGLDTEGEMEYGPHSSGPQTVDDTYEQRWAIRVANRATTDDAMTRLDEIVKAWRAAISTTADLDLMEGDGWYVQQSTPGFLSTGYGDDPTAGVVAGATFGQRIELRITDPTA